jgi:DNA-binding beta-propeller fold protein YncE
VSERDVPTSKCGRREFIEGCAAAATAATAAGVLGGNVAGGAEAAGPNAPRRFDYVPVPDWPRLPKDVAFVGVNGIATDGQGRVYAAGGDPNAILVFAPDGKFLAAWGKDTIKAKHGLRIFGERLFVADTEMHQMYEFTLDGRLLRSLGTRGKPGLGQDQFNQPTDVAIAPDGDMFITDGYGNSRVVRLAPDGSFRLAWGSPGEKPGEFHSPHNVVLDKAGLVYIADRENDRIQVFTPEGKFLKQWRNVGKPFGLFLTPDQTLWVSDGNPKGPHRILALNLDGEVLAAFGSTGSAPGQLNVPHSIDIDRQGNLYVAEVENKRIQKFVPRK